MKKISMIAAFALVAGYAVYQSQQKEQMSDIALENVEALASGESNGDCQTYCQPDYGYSCIIIWGEGIEGVTCTNHRKA